jgi:hypothetical protein
MNGNICFLRIEMAFFLHVVFCCVLGGLEEFRTQCSDDHINTQESRPLYSPTTPIIEPQIETATASEILPFLYLGKDSILFSFICYLLIWLNQLIKKTSLLLDSSCWINQCFLKLWSKTPTFMVNFTIITNTKIIW